MCYLFSIITGIHLYVFEHTYTNVCIYTCIYVYAKGCILVIFLVCMYIHTYVCKNTFFLRWELLWLVIIEVHFFASLWPWLYPPSRLILWLVAYCIYVHVHNSYVYHGLLGCMGCVPYSYMYSRGRSPKEYILVECWALWTSRSKPAAIIRCLSWMIIWHGLDRRPYECTCSNICKSSRSTMLDHYL